MKIIRGNRKNIKEIITALKNGAVLISPTDTVYGFLADASNKKAVDRIFKIKKRVKSNPLPIFVKDLKMAKKLAEINSKQEKILKKYWPGKFTFILKAKKIEIGSLFSLSGLVTGRDGTIALRIPKYKFLNDLLKKINKPLAQTSVNISNQPSLTKISDIIKQFNRYSILIIKGGDIRNNKSSKIIDLTKNRIKILRK